MRGAKSGVRMKKVLLVEDNSNLQFLLTYQIESMGFTVITANNGKERVEKAIGAALKPGVIISLLSLLPFSSAKGKFRNSFLLQAQKSNNGL